MAVMSLPAELVAEAALKMRKACKQTAIDCAKELKRNADMEDDQTLKEQLLSEAIIAWDIAARIDRVTI